MLATEVVGSGLSHRAVKNRPATTVLQKVGCRHRRRRLQTDREADAHPFTFMRSFRASSLTGSASFSASGGALDGGHQPTDTMASSEARYESDLRVPRIRDLISREWWHRPLESDEESSQGAFKSLVSS